jgi:hypothetical protein
MGCPKRPSYGPPHEFVEILEPSQLNLSLKNASNGLTTLRYFASIIPGFFGMNLTIGTFRKRL